MAMGWSMACRWWGRYGCCHSTGFRLSSEGRLRPLVEIGILGLHAMARELTPGGGGIAPPTFGFHRERGIALNRTTGARLKGR